MLTAGQSPKSARFGLVLLHGRGAGAADIIGLGEALALPDLSFAAPEATGRSWWPTSFLAPSEQMEPHVARGIDQVEAAIDGFVTAGMTRDKIGVLGFSQGSCLAAEYIARHGAGLACGILLSGGLVGTGDSDDKPTDALYGYGDKCMNYYTKLSNAPIYMSCHAADPHIPLKRFSDSAKVFEDMGAAVTAHTKTGQGHGIDQGDVVAIRKMLNV